MLWVGSILFICIKGSSVNYKRFQYLLRRVQTHLPDFSTYLPHKRMLYSTFPPASRVYKLHLCKSHALLFVFYCSTTRRPARFHHLFFGAKRGGGTFRSTTHIGWVYRTCLYL